MPGNRLSALPQLALWTLVAAAIAAVMAYFRLNWQHGLLNGDDWIVLGVVKGMVERGDLNTNWAVNPVPPEWRFPEFNFSAYNLTAHAILRVFDTAEDDIPVLRGANLAMQALAVLVLAWALKNARVPALGIALAAALFALAPGLVHDAHMLRTESLLYLLFAIVVWAATSPSPLPLRAAIAGLAIGFGAASKVTFLLSALVMVPIVLIALRRTPRSGLLAGLAAVAATAIGFAIGAPYALLDPEAFIEGVRILNQQYAGGHRPHSRISYDLLGQAWWILSFFTLLYGPLFVAGFAAPVLARPPAWVVGLWANGVVTTLWFVQQRVFFERNLSLVIVGAAVLVGWLAAARPRTAVTIAVLSALPMVWWSQQILEGTLDPHVRRQQWEQAQGLEVAHYANGWEPIADDWSRCDGVFGVREYNDDWTERTLARLDARGQRRLAEYHGRFHLAPTSTLQNFLDADIVYYACDAAQR